MEKINLSIVYPIDHLVMTLLSANNLTLKTNMIKWK